MSLPFCKSSRIFAINQYSCTIPIISCTFLFYSNVFDWKTLIEKVFLRKSIQLVSKLLGVIKMKLCVTGRFVNILITILRFRIRFDWNGKWAAKLARIHSGEKFQPSPRILQLQTANLFSGSQLEKGAINSAPAVLGKVSTKTHSKAAIRKQIDEQEEKHSAKRMLW